MKNYILDQIDKEILWALNENARYSATKIGQLIGVSKQRAAFRIRRMIKLGILELFSVIINKSKLGYFHCQVYIKINKPLSEKTILLRLKNIPLLYWEAITTGEYNLVIFFLAKSLEDTEYVYKKIIDQLTGDISKKEILLSARTYFLQHGFLTNASKRISILEIPGEIIKLKQRDLNLINAIKEHGRIKINNLAREIKMTPYTICQRISYLKRKGIIIGFKVRINRTKLGFKRYLLMLSFSEISEIEKKKIINFLTQEKGTTRIIETVGKWDLICEMSLPKDQNSTKWLKKIFQHNRIPKGKILSNILEINKVLPINNVIYS